MIFSRRSLFGSLLALGTIPFLKPSSPILKKEGRYTYIWVPSLQNYTNCGWLMYDGPHVEPIDRNPESSGRAGGLKK